jgi:hypothetical protein
MILDELIELKEKYQKSVNELEANLHRGMEQNIMLTADEMFVKELENIIAKEVARESR